MIQHSRDVPCLSAPRWVIAIAHAQVQRETPMADQSGADAEALWYVGPGRVEIRRETISEPKPGEVRIRALYSAISRGTERLVSAGRVPETEYERMRAPFMGGAFPFPVKYGYATVGRVERGPVELRDRIVFALHPHQSVFVLPTEAVAADTRWRAARPRRARRQHGDRAQCDVGRGAGDQPTKLRWWERASSARWSLGCAAEFPARK